MLMLGLKQERVVMLSQAFLNGMITKKNVNPVLNSTNSQTTIICYIYETWDFTSRQKQLRTAYRETPFIS